MSDLLRQEFLERINNACELDDWTRVEQWARQWLQASSRDPEGFRWLARASHSLHKLERAAYAYNRVLDYIPGDKEARNFFEEYPSTSSRDTAEKSSDSEEINFIGSRESLSPKERKDLANAEYTLGQKYMGLRLFAMAAERFEQSFHWSPSENAALECGRAYHAAKETHKAVRFLRDQILESQNWVEGRVLLGRILYDLGQLNSAQKEWQQALKIEPENRTALDYLRRCLTR